jgi:hypothetical protein
MAAPIGYGIWLWFKSNPAAQWAAGIGAGLLLFFSWLGLRDRRIRREERLKQRAENMRQKERAVEYVETLKQEAQDEAEQAIDRRDTAQPLDPERMSDAQRKRIFGRGAATGDGSKRR